MPLSTRPAFLLSAAILAASLTPAFAAPPKNVLRASVSSLNDAQKFLAQLGVSLPIASLIESRLKLEPGSIDPSQPIGLVAVADRESLTAEDSGLGAVVFVLPVLPGKSTAAQLRASGGSEVIDRGPDFSQRNGLYFKRSDSHLFVTKFTDHPAGLVNDAVFQSDYAKSPPLAAATLNFAALKAADDRSYKKLFAASPLSHAADTPSFLEKLDRISLQASADTANLQLQIWCIPSTMQAPPSRPRPAFPAGAIAECHIAVPTGSTSPLLAALTASGPDATSLAPVLKNIGAAGEVSFAVTLSPDNKPTLYLVQQLDDDTDVAAAVKSSWATAAKSNSSLKPTSSYQSSGKTITRADLPDAANPAAHLYLDTLQSGHTFYATLSPTDTHSLDALLAAGMSGQIPAGTLATGSADPGKLLQALSTLAPQAVHLPAAMIGSSLTGQQIAWTCQVSDAAFLYTNIQVPLAMVKPLAAMLTQGTETPGALTPAKPAATPKSEATSKPKPAPKPAPKAKPAPKPKPKPTPAPDPNRPVDNLL